MSRRKLFILRSVSVFLLITILTELVFPGVSWALTGGPSAPEVYAYQPSDATDNVNMMNGDFNYTIPVTSVPDYPMAIGYASNGGMDQDAGIFGFGVNGFSGAIARSMQGLPDDAYGAPRYFKYECQPNWSVSVQGDLTAAKLPLSPGPEDIGIPNVSANIGLNVSLMIGYDNYKGMFGAVGLGAGLILEGSKRNPADKWARQPSKLFGSLNVGLNSAYGLSGGVGIGYGNYTSAGISGVQGQQQLSAYAGLSFNEMSFGLSNFSNASNGAGSYLPQLANVVATTKGLGASLTVPIPVEPQVSVTARYNSFNYGNLDDTRSSYGFMYLSNYDRRNRDHIADFAVEGEDAYYDPARNNPSLLQRDYFVVNSQGIYGSMQLYQDQYGVVSRNYDRFQTRDIGLTGLVTERKETEQWTNISRSVINKQLDIIKLLKKSDEQDEKDFDKTIFIDNELMSLTSSEYKFDHTAKFKMRGDLANQFNLSSSSYNDFRANDYDLLYLSGGGNSKFSFLKEEKDMPLYYPKPKDSTSQHYNDSRNKILTANKITYYTIGRILALHNSDGLTTYNPINNHQGLLFNESFLSHQQYTNSVDREDPDSINSSNISSFNIIKHLQDLKNSSAGGAYMDSIIGDIRVRNTEGMTYVYNLPVFNITTKTLQMSGKAQLAPSSSTSGSDGDYHSFYQNSKPKERGKVKVTEKYAYPYAWMLTAVVGPDYIDFDSIKGPSDGDLGYWVKFRYVKVTDDNQPYHWRTPYTGMAHMSGALHTTADDGYYVTSGSKELYYISEIESRDYTCKYTYHKRFDGIDAGGTDMWNGDGHFSLNQNKVVPGNPTGTGFQFAVTRIGLFKKHYDNNNSGKRSVANKQGKLVRATEFKYDYSICPKTPNNLTNYSPYTGITASQLSYHVKNGTPYDTAKIGNGKLTLRKVRHISYEGNPDGVYLPSYELKYGFDESNQEELNPQYDERQLDEWGNYAKNTRTIINNSDIKDVLRNTPSNLKYYNGYCELDQVQADRNAQAFKLSKILLPGGGSMKVSFEAQSYNKVQELSPFVMRRVIGINPDTVLGSLCHGIRLTVDITDLGKDGKKLDSLLAVGNPLYGEVAFYESNNAPDFPKREDELFIANGPSRIKKFGSTYGPDANGRYYQHIYLRTYEGDSLHTKPYVSTYRTYLYGESDKMKAIKESVSGSCDKISNVLDKYATLEKDKPLDALRKMIANVKNYFKKDNSFKTKFNSCFGSIENQVFPHYSFLRTPAYKGKYTGSRVKSIAFSDNFKYATGPVDGVRENVYVTNYFYDDKGTGEGKSKGVATIEPCGGNSAVIDIRQRLGASFFPAPAIMYAQTTMETGYSANGTSIGDKVSRRKGKAQYSFYTPADEDYSFDNNFIASNKIQQPGNPEGKFYLFGIMTWLIIKFKIIRHVFTIRLPLPIPLQVKWNRSDNYHLKTYSVTDMSDMYGKPKSIVQLSASGQEVSRNEFNYFGKNEAVAAYDGSNGGPANDPFGSAAKQVKPGRMDQVWSEAYFTKESKIKLIPWILLLNANTERNFVYTNVKYTYVPPVLKGVTNINSLDGSKESTSYTAFDYYTGQPLQEESKDSYGNTKISRTIPAYWKYPQMGPVTAAHPEYLNMLNATTGNYMYLNSVSNSNLLGTSITEWSKDSLHFASGVRNLGRQYTSDNLYFNYVYEVIGGDTLEKIYNANGKTRASLNSSITNKISSVYLPVPSFQYRPVKNHTYEVDLKGNGTFSSYTAFDYSAGVQPSNTGWKLLSTSTLFDLDGNIIETKDVLNKYAAAHFGYNFANSTASVSNSTWSAAAYSGAENTYDNRSFSAKYLDDYRIKLQDANVLKACAPTFVSKTFIYNNYTSGTPAKLLSICAPDTPVYNKSFARVNVAFAGSDGNPIKRTLYISMNENNDFKIITDKGEAFKGFYVIPGPASGSCSYNAKLAFDPAVLTTFSLDNGYTNSGYIVTSATELLGVCSNSNITYSLPDNSCTGAAHTGNNAFSLTGSGSKGTRFEIPLSTLPASEKGRKYKAMVWVHNSSPKQCSLVVENQSASVIKSVDFSHPVMVAGNWSLLRLDVDPSEYGSATKLVFYMLNSSSSGTVIYDDYRVLPYQGAMESFVYDPETGRITATLNNDNIATFYQYDSRGRLIEVKTEIENIGPQTIKKYLYNEQKVN